MNSAQAYIFDWFGTLVKPVNNQGFKLLSEQILKHNPNYNNRDLQHYLMITNKSISDILDSDHNYLTVDLKQKICDLICNDVTELYDDSDSLKTLLSNWYPVWILSNLSYDYGEILNNHVEKPLQSYIDSGQLFLGYSYKIWFAKPDPQSYKIVIDQLKKYKSDLDESDVCMIWDNPKYDHDIPVGLWLKAIYLNRKNEPTERNSINSLNQLI